jgi:hypothetical protein
MTRFAKIGQEPNVGLGKVIFSVNVGTKRRCFRAEPFIFSGRYISTLAIFRETRDQRKWQLYDSFIAGAQGAREFRDIYLPTRLQLISVQHLPTLA